MARLLLVLSLILLILSPAWANNGMQNIGFGAQMVGRGGADVAFGDSPLSLTTNPANLLNLKGDQLLVGFMAMKPFYGFKNRWDSSNGEHPIFFVPALAFSSNQGRWAWGVALYNEGGTASQMGSLKTPEGRSINNKMGFGYMKLALGLAYEVTPWLRVGIAPNVGYASIPVMKMPFTTPMGTLRFHARELRDVVGGVKLGVTFHDGDRAAMGFSYTPKVPFKLEGVVRGDMRGDATIRFAWPEKYSVGLMVRPWKRLRLLADLSLLKWSHGMDRVDFTLKHARIKGVDAGKMKFTMPTDWKDQWVWALGLEYYPSDAIVIRLGYNHAREPVPLRSLFTLTPVLVENHLTAGLGLRERAWEVHLSLEYGLHNRLKSKAKSSIDPYFNGAEVEMGYVAVHVTCVLKF